MSDLTDKLRILVEWEDPGGAKGEDLRATWCRLVIKVGDVPITRVLDDRAQSVREAIYGPAYPLAEWIAFNWWPLIHEAERPTSIAFAKRHNIRFARDGFALPDLEFFFEDSVVRAVWKPFRPKAAPIRFLEPGFAFICKQDFISEIRSFVDTVAARLESAGIGNTSLNREWREISNVTSDELEFCEASGALGLDPYCLDDKKSAEIIEVEQSIPAELKKEFFLAADPEILRKQANWVKKCLGELEDYATNRHTFLADKKGRYRDYSRVSEPWQTGYELARKFRSEFKLGKEKLPLSYEKSFGLPKTQLPIIHVSGDLHLGGVARLEPTVGPQVATTKQRETSKQFLLVSALCEYLCADGENSALLSHTKSDRQRRNGAFAAELLAPSAGIREHLSGGRVTEDEVSDVAEYFNVSEWVIKHQIQNHRLAAVEGVSDGTALYRLIHTES